MHFFWHIGWNNLYFVDPHSQDCIFDKKINKASMYFVHSYKVECNNDENILATTSYNDVSIAAVINKDNAYGCQFHPEKSGKYGLELLERFVKL